MIVNHPLDIQRSIISFSWLRERIPCPDIGTHGDTYPLTWGADGYTYMSSGDPNWACIGSERRHVGWDESISKPELYPHVGGADVELLTGRPEKFHIEQVNTLPGFIGPGGNGAKPSGIISIDGTLYLAVQNLLGSKPPRQRLSCQHGSDSTIIQSTDFGRTWQPDIQPILQDMEHKLYDRKAWKWNSPPEQRTSWMGWEPMFPGALFGGPSFVQFGRDNAGRVDNFTYAISADQWDNGSELRLGRAEIGKILDKEAWSWACVQGNGQVKWSSDLNQSEPVLIMEGHISLPEMVYLPSIGRYLLLTWALHKDFHTEKGSELTILESENPWGPFRLVHYEQLWETVDVCPYCPRIPLQWFDHTLLTGWLLHSGNWLGTEHYKAHVRPFQLHVVR